MITFKAGTTEQRRMEMKEAFKRVVLARKATRAFNTTRSVNPSTLNEILRLTLRAPSSFNLMPFKCIIVRDSMVRQKLAYCMTSGNIKRVLDAPVTAVFAADLAPAKRISSMIAMEKERGVLSKVQLEGLEFGARAIVGPDKPAALSSGEQLVRKTIFDVMSHLTQMPTISATQEAWSYKNTMLAVHGYLLACTAHGLATAPMEGFDGRRVREALAIPETYAIPVVVATGYADGDEDGVVPPSKRMPFEDMFSADAFDFPLYDDDGEENAVGG